MSSSVIRTSTSPQRPLWPPVGTSHAGAQRPAWGEFKDPCATSARAALPRGIAAAAGDLERAVREGLQGEAQPMHAPRLGLRARSAPPRVTPELLRAGPPQGLGASLGAIGAAPEVESWEPHIPPDDTPWVTMMTGAALGALSGAYLGTLLAAASRGVWGLVGMSLSMSAMCCLGGVAAGFLVGCALESLWPPIAAALAAAFAGEPADV